MRALLIGYAVLGLAACASQAPVAQTPTPSVTAAVQAPATAEIAVTLEVVPATPAPLVDTLTIWLPDAIAPADDVALSAALDVLITDYALVEPSVNIEVRRKAAFEAGGIFNQLRSANAVAPGALPDVTLLQHDDLLLAMQADLIHDVTLLQHDDLLLAMQA
ncbi:MAG: hypothetical protein H7Y11_03570, partial [Armatimonadetes bacterium]|nr:hypothetical protein [Anaerolineae bacterium]